MTDARRDLRRLAAAVALSAMGDMLALIALVLAVHDLTASGFAVSALFATTLVPVVAMAPVAGLLVDRFENVRVLVAASLAQAAVAAVLALAVGRPGAAAGPVGAAVGRVGGQPAGRGGAGPRHRRPGRAGPGQRSHGERALRGLRRRAGGGRRAQRRRRPGRRAGGERPQLRGHRGRGGRRCGRAAGPSAVGVTARRWTRPWPVPAGCGTTASCAWSSARPWRRWRWSRSR